MSSYAATSALWFYIANAYRFIYETNWVKVRASNGILIPGGFGT
jgi:hypothetical protein